MKYLATKTYIVVNILTILLQISWVLCTESSVTPASNKCNEDNLIEILAFIQVINPESLIKLALIKNLDISCKQIRKSLEKIDDYYKVCILTQDKTDLYFQLSKGLSALNQRVCETSPFQQSFKRIHNCLHELKNDFEDCSGPADWNENPQEILVCKAYKDICDCFYIKTAKVCGIESAKIIKQLITEVFDDVLTVTCSNVKDDPKVDNPMPETYIRKNQANVLKSPLIRVIIMISVHLIINYN